MFTLSVVFGNASIGFMFKTQEAADNAATALVGIPAMGAHVQKRIPIEDDFGQRGVFSAESIHGIIVENMELTAVARAEQMVHQARCQNKAAKLASADPALRMMNSPPVLNPMGNGMMR